MLKKSKELLDHIAQNGGKISDWYVGTTNNIKARIEQHEKEGCRPKNTEVAFCESKEIADEVEKELIDKRVRGHQGGTRDNSTTVYVFYDPNMKH